MRQSVYLHCRFTPPCLSTYVPKLFLCRYSRMYPVLRPEPERVLAVQPSGGHMCSSLRNFVRVRPDANRLTNAGMSMSATIKITSLKPSISHAPMYVYTGNHKWPTSSFLKVDLMCYLCICMLAIQSPCAGYEVSYHRFRVPAHACDILSDEWFATTVHELTYE